MTRAVLDANVFISGTVSAKGFCAAILDAWRGDRFEMVTCPAIIQDIGEKLRLPRIQKKYHISEEHIGGLLSQLAETSLMMPGLADVSPEPPDPDDVPVFAAAIESRATYVVTGDKPLLSFDWKGPFRVVTPREFWEAELALLQPRL